MIDTFLFSKEAGKSLASSCILQGFGWSTNFSAMQQDGKSPLAFKLQTWFNKSLEPSKVCTSDRTPCHEQCYPGVSTGLENDSWLVHCWKHMKEKGAFINFNWLSTSKQLGRSWQATPGGVISFHYWVSWSILCSDIKSNTTSGTIDQFHTSASRSSEEWKRHGKRKTKSTYGRKSHMVLEAKLLGLYQSIFQSL